MQKKDKDNLVNATLLVASTIGILAPFPGGKSKNRETLPQESVLTTKFVFVTTPGGEPIFSSPGSDQIARLSKQSYVGVWTGNQVGEYIEVSTGIDTQPSFFWIDVNGVEFEIGKDNAAIRIENGAIQKSNAILTKIYRANHA